MFNKRQIQRPDNEKFYLRAAIILIIVAILIICAFILSTLYPVGQLFQKNNGKYQAVFLSSGQVYFGKASKLNSKYIEMIDVYYLQVKNPQAANAPSQGATIQSGGQQETALVKLGDELHGPTNKMLINQSQIVMIEDLRDDSKIVQAIEGNQK